MAGVRVPPEPFTLAPTPPPDINVEQWEASLETIAGWEPQALALTHWGQVDDPPEQLDRVRESLHAQADFAEQHDEDGFVEAYSARVHEQAGERRRRDPPGRAAGPAVPRPAAVSEEGGAGTLGADEPRPSSSRGRGVPDPGSTTTGA